MLHPYGWSIHVPSVVTVEGTIYTAPEDDYNVNRDMSGFLLRF